MFNCWVYGRCIYTVNGLTFSINSMNQQTSLGAPRCGTRGCGAWKLCGLGWGSDSGIVWTCHVILWLTGFTPAEFCTFFHEFAIFFWSPLGCVGETFQHTTTWRADATLLPFLRVWGMRLSASSTPHHDTMLSKFIPWPGQRMLEQFIAVFELPHFHLQGISHGTT